MFVWLAVVFFSVLIGVCCFRFFEGCKASLFSALISWGAFLVFNVYFEVCSQDRDVMRGSWFLFQLIFGSLVAFLSVSSGWLSKKILSRKSRGTD